MIHALPNHTAQRRIWKRCVKHIREIHQLMKSPVKNHHEEEELPVKKFHHLSRLLKEKWREGAKKASKQPVWKQNSTEPHDGSLSQMTRWSYRILDKRSFERLPQVAVVAIDLLIIPGSSAPVERTFSTAEDSSSGKLHRLVDKNLEREVLIQKNRQYPIGFLLCELWS